MYPDKHINHLKKSNVTKIAQFNRDGTTTDAARNLQQSVMEIISSTEVRSTSHSESV